MPAYVYRGPSDEFVVDGKTYKQGDKLNLAEKVVKHHAVHGHVFEKDGDLIGNAVENKAVAKAEDK